MTTTNQWPDHIQKLIDQINENGFGWREDQAPLCALVAEIDKMLPADWPETWREQMVSIYLKKLARDHGWKRFWQTWPWADFLLDFVVKTVVK